MADTLYSNLGTGTDVYYCCEGWTISGTGTIGASFTAANEFQVVQSGNPIQIDVAVGYVTGVNSFYLWAPCCAGNLTYNLTTLFCLNGDPHENAYCFAHYY